MADDIKNNKKDEYSLFWSIFLVGSANLIIFGVLLIDIKYFWSIIFAVMVINTLLVVFSIIGIYRYKETKDKDLEATTFSRKMFNIISGLIIAGLIWLFSPIMTIFLLFGIDFAFGFHEVIYVKFKKKTYFTDALIALGRQSEPYKPYLASITALLGLTTVLTYETILFQITQIINYEYVVMIVYIGVILIWGIGDTMAYFVGTQYGRHKLSYNKKKSWEGFLANMAVSIAIGFVFFSSYFLEFITMPWIIILPFIGGIGAAFFESIDIKIDDNFVNSAFTGILMTNLIILIS
ncbi:MAG: hypothetical protein EU549_00260 [Promethearchaeota archaeon]|nr:MAG: hypothetical protein EU549_00260 [Candidatus Lokiarchaeota archaeon]